MANTTQTPTKKTADPSDSENNSDAVAGNEAGGVENSENTSISSLTPEQQAEVNRQIANVRRQAEEKGKNKALRELNEAQQTERQKQLEEQEEYKPLYEQLKVKYEETTKRAEAAERANLTLEVALEQKLPNPQLAAKRLIGETREELVEDAKALLKVLKSDEPDKSTESDKKETKDKSGDPPATSEGGDLTTVNQPTEEKEETKFYAQKATDTYNF